MAVTIKDIARRAGVDHTTVSRALRGSPLISAEATRRIRQIAGEMGYLPSAAARSLKTRRSGVLGVIISHIADPFFSEVLQGIDDVAQPGGYSLFIASSQREFDREQAIVRTMIEHRVDGLIVCSTPFSAARHRPYLTAGTPIVVINNQAAEDDCFSIYHDDLDGSRQVTRHLLRLGHRRIAYLGNCRSGRTNQERLAGYLGEMAAAGCPVLAGFVHEAADSDLPSGAAAARHFLDLPERPTAIFCFNDSLAAGLLQELQQAGLRVPRDCSVAGFDNIAFSAYTFPPLTTLDQPKRQIGAQATRLLLQQVDPDPREGAVPGPRTQALQGRLLVRASTAPPPVLAQE